MVILRRMALPMTSKLARAASTTSARTSPSPTTPAGPSSTTATTPGTSRPAYTFTGSEAAWDSGTIVQTASARGQWYLHVQSHSPDHDAGGAQIVGPFEVGATGGTTIYVDVDAAGASDGTSWTDAFTDLQDGLAAAIDGDEIWVAEGTYSPGPSRSDTFQLVAGVAVYGGFAAIETTRGQRDWTTHITRLSGDVAGDDDGFANRGDNNRHVVTGADLSILDGATIGGGAADGASAPDDAGGGMLNIGVSPEVANCTFEMNRARRGGGMYNESCSPDVGNCAFAGNLAYSDLGGGSPDDGALGGGMCNVGASPTIVGCDFQLNSAVVATVEYASGGGIYTADASTATVQGCSFVNNTARYGAALCHRNAGCEPEVTNCEFTGHAGDIYGVVANLAGCAPAIRLCIFSGNAGTRGVGIFNEDASGSITSCTFHNNTASGGAGGIYTHYGSPTISDCLFIGNSGSIGGALHTGLDAAVVTHCVLQGNTATDKGGALVIGGESTPSFTHCRFLDNSAPSCGAFYMEGTTDSLRCAATFDDCVFLGNAATTGNAGVGHAMKSASTYTRCQFAGNRTAGTGGAFYLERNADTFINCTFASNRADGSAGAIHVAPPLQPETVTLRNTIVWDCAGSNTHIVLDDSPHACTLAVSYCAVEVGLPGIGVGANWT
ncbi:right-handed parallel beta-helix repeat-containing protein, partial [Planctomycetota bacterium]